jgi:hypothetical protein
MQALLLVAEHDGPMMLARIGVMRALNRGYERRFSRPTREFLERVSNHHFSHCREIAPFRQARNPGKLPDTVHCNHCTVPAAQVARRQNPKRGLRRSCPDWDQQ